MRFLFVHQNFPGQFLHILRHLVRSGEHEILFICEPNQNFIPGVRKIPYQRPTLDIPETHLSARELDNGMRRAEAVFKAAWGLRYLGFEPDIIIGHHGWGEMLNLRDVWPNAPMLGYFEFYYQHDRADVGFDPEFPCDPSDYGRVRAKNAINHLALNLGGVGQSPTNWQLSTYPDWARKRIRLLWEGVDLDVCRPDPAVRRKTLKVGGMAIRPSDKLVTYVSRDLEPYRGFHSMMRALPALMRARKDLKVIMIGGDGVSYGAAPPQGGTWREVMLKEVGADIDLDRVVFPGRVAYDVYVSALRRSDAHVYLTYPFVASWSLREALAMGCPIIGGDTPTVNEFITPNETGVLTPFLQPKLLARDILNVVEDKKLSANLRTKARAYAEKHLAMKDYLASYTSLIKEMTGQDLNVSARPSKGRDAPRIKVKANGKAAEPAPALRPKGAKPVARPARKPPGKPVRAAAARMG
ncbi:MAG TPA: glycosyltransferase [Rhodopila sp.]|uniref:glycosyltransferase n=1 Tax=Rhodopila sp. TaxID=2480087 RepID=UPI002B936F48|nr:glycosyltransferase [Rhodopila sp.]HVY15712.1 glycosyltransferase [Rhodopila sp.]